MVMTVKNWESAPCPTKPEQYLQHFNPDAVLYGSRLQQFAKTLSALFFFFLTIDRWEGANC